MCLEEQCVLQKFHAWQKCRAWQNIVYGGNTCLAEQIALQYNVLDRTMHLASWQNNSHGKTIWMAKWVLDETICFAILRALKEHACQNNVFVRPIVIAKRVFCRTMHMAEQPPWENNVLGRNACLTEQCAWQNSVYGRIVRTAELVLARTMCLVELHAWRN